MTKKATRKGDKHNCSEDNHSGGEIIEGSENINIEGLPAARVGDAAKCENGGENLIQKGSTTVFFNDKPAARINDNLEHGGIITSGANNVFIGSGGNQVRFGNKGRIEIGGKGTVIIGGKSAASNPVPDISCEKAMSEIQSETKNISNINDNLKRNNKITAAYVKLYQKNPALEWAHTAIYASKQVGFAMQHGYKMVGGTNFISKKIGDFAIVNFLGQGNKRVFMDIFPILKFYNTYSYQKLKQCYENPTGNQKILMDAIAKIDEGKLEEGAIDMLKHEQNNILQKMYNNFSFSLMVSVNHGISKAANTFDDYVKSIGILSGLISTTPNGERIANSIQNSTAPLRVTKSVLNTFSNPEKVSLTADKEGGVEYDMSDIDIRDPEARIESATKLVNLVKKNGYDNYLEEKKTFEQLLALE